MRLNTFWVPPISSVCMFSVFAIYWTTLGKEMFQNVVGHKNYPIFQYPQNDVFCDHINTELPPKIKGQTFFLHQKQK